LEKVDINQVLNQIITEYEDVKPPELELQTDMDDTCLPVFVDQRLFQESIRELFRNATNAIKEDWPGFIRVTSRPTMQDGKECVRIAVMDNGGGLPKEGNPFEPYFTTGEKGSGLGLATVKRVVERHNGTVTGKNWESDTGLGAAIEIILPAAQERGSRT
jgi:nitrogen fixation/metabolism regulation signal transduction histidine kinase